MYVSLTTSSRAIGAVAVTVPTCWYLLSNTPEPAHGHGDHGDSHGEEHEEEHKEESKDEPEEESKDEDKEASSDAEDKDSEKSEDSDSVDDEKKGANTPDSSDNEGAEDSEAKEDGNTKKHIPDAKGGAKKRIESDNAIKAGESASSDDAVCLDQTMKLCSFANVPRPLRPSHLEARTHRRRSKKDSQTRIQSTLLISPTIPQRARRVKVHRILLRSRELLTQKDLKYRP